MKISRYSLDKNIFICGFMASGKSTLGRELAGILNAHFVDVDERIQDKEKKSIIEIFQTKGEKYFRDMERQTLHELIQDFNGVISLGGGALHNQQVVDDIKRNGILIFLDVPLNEILERVYRRDHRPILFNDAGKIKPKQVLFDELKTLYFQREKYYKQADIILDGSDFSSPSEMAAALIKKV